VILLGVVVVVVFLVVGSSHVLLRGQRQLQALDTFPSLTDAYEDM